LSDALDIVIDVGGIDTIRSGLDIALPDFIEHAELTGIGDSSITGNAGANRLTGNLGNNLIDGGLGVDTLTGGAGGDQFVIASNGAGNAADLITDLKAVDDLIVVDLASFGVDTQALGIDASGLLTSNAFVKGAGAQSLDTDDRFLLDTATNVLWFDPDGSGSASALEIARFGPNLDANISAANVYVVI
jgi:serralysin